jgi:deazaflavin-dependent oxidoreductase (nitroreductase family)
VRPARRVASPVVVARLRLQRWIDPGVRLVWRARIPIPGDALLETTGRRTGRPRRTPVCDGRDGNAFWLVAQRGRGADWVRNIEADPRVRIRTSGWGASWRTGTAHILDGDDAEERRRIMSRSRPTRRLCHCTSATMDIDPLTIRIDLDPS